MPDPNSKVPSTDLAALDWISGNEAVDGRLNVAQMISLIDSILPFEACLYHEIIPLSVESSCLHLGMVHPTDTVAMDYARKQVSFIHCSVVSWPVTSDWQRKVLSKYLSHTARAKTQTRSAQIPQGPSPREELLTFIVDSPEILQTESLAPPTTNPTHLLAPSSGAETSPMVAEPPLAFAFDAAVTQVPLQRLPYLPPPELTQALLSQVLTSGIGRLFFERGSTHGRVLWSKDGVVQAVLKALSLDQFQGVINELKRLHHLPLLPTTQTKQVDIERLYKGDRVLLRLRLTVGNHGEEATLQVLRGAALTFYQRQQLKQLGEDALGVAQTLQKRIIEIRERARQSLVPKSPSARNLAELSELLKTMEKELEEIKRLSENTE
ncbi:hypothetical protein IQ254_16245 [Nodosilinea sp. LEGE 07088]|uniref:hypothetical protein n=1 Tax=Nodosilinea sp. LEGE 07088 TaxID=2777968 RepID=UPI001881720D|nr:hypothetical protein [Nodosilinea sp. LEGE 07088]MBE9138725.1 hypothetical protein [Nodosilinea sp. LEGE 07088]